MLDDLEVRIRVKLAEAGRHQVHHIEVRHLELRKTAFRCGAERLRGTHMAGTGGYAEHKDALARLRATCRFLQLRLHRGPFSCSPNRCPSIRPTGSPSGHM